MKQITSWAADYLTVQRADWGNHHLAVVFDIDDTVLRKTTKHTTTAFQEMMRLYHIARNLKYSIFFVTARVETPENRRLTEEELQTKKFTNHSGLFMMPLKVLENLETPNWSMYKYDTRVKIASTNKCQIVLNVGDQMGDLALLAPFQTDPSSLALIRKIEESYDFSQFVIFVPPDVAWMAIKMPHDPSPS